MPGPLSETVTRKRVAWLAGGGVAPSLAATSTLTATSGRMPASSDASSALSTASLTQVRSALRGLSNPSRWRFLVKNSETEISRCRAPISIAETVVAGLAGFASTTSASATFGSRAFALGLGLALVFFLGLVLAIAVISRRQCRARGYPTRRGEPRSGQGTVAFLVALPRAAGTWAQPGSLE